jgi:DNA-binding XRE family transcriptional regulator
MATQRKNRGRERGSPSASEQIARLRSEVQRLRSVIRQLKGRPSDAGGEKRATARSASRSAPTARPALVLPQPDAEGNYPAAETLRLILAQQIAGRRAAAGWTQAELARRAGVRQETVSRIESGKNAPNVATVDKLDRALQQGGV